MAGKGQAEGCAACAKWLLIIFNILFCILGIGMLAAGIYSYIALREYLDFLGNSKINLPGIVLIVFGCITFIIAAVGCIGACKESPCLLFTFAAIIAALLIAEIVVGAVAFVYKAEVEELVVEEGQRLLNTAKENFTATDGVMKTWNTIQRNLKCCGLAGPEDWSGDATNVPASCKNPETQEVYPVGCKDGLIKFMEANIIVVGGVAIAFGVIELMGIVFACCVGCAARKGEYA